jgi:hypothetical protein
MTVLARTSSNLPSPTTITSTPGKCERERERETVPETMDTNYIETGGVNKSP